MAPPEHKGRLFRRPLCCWARTVTKVNALLLESVNIFAYRSIPDARGGNQVKQSEFRRWLASQGAPFEDGAKHLRVYLNGRQSTLPPHLSHEIREGLRKAILKRLGLSQDPPCETEFVVKGVWICCGFLPMSSPTVMASSCLSPISRKP
ncbi:hypothetical protein D9M70_528290 [compost metagenome]